MHLARPGQILLSSVAEPLLRRSVSELGERGDALQWRTHGRWLFKGVPKSQEVHEVGEPGLAPLRAPRGDAKARRDVPAWRHPLALAAEAAAVVGLVVGGWFMTRPEPAIAFAERDWVVLGDLRNATGDTSYDGAIEAALRTSLEQSQFVNVIPDARAQGVLALMKKPAGSIDRASGIGIALRTGARMLLLPAVSDSGGRVRVDIEVVDPSTTNTVLSLGATGRGGDSVIRSTGQVAESLRAKLGENAAAIARSSLPLEQVTTSSIEALRAFTLGQRAYALRDLDKAEQHFRQALQLDPDFAMARIGLARTAFARTDIATAQGEMKAALSEASKLTNRERLYADAQLSLLLWEKGYQSKWGALSDLYPDFDVAAFNAAFGMSMGNRFKEMRMFSERAVAVQGVTLPVAIKFRAIANAGLGDLGAASADCADARGEGAGNQIECELFKEVAGSGEQALAALRPIANEPEFAAVERAAAELNVLADEGRWEEAGRKARALIEARSKPVLPFDWFARSSALEILSHQAEKTELRQQVSNLLDLAEREMPAAAGRARDSVAAAALHAGYVAAGMGEFELAERAQRMVRQQIDASPDPLLANASDIVTARLQRSKGEAQAALNTLARYDDPSVLALTWVERAKAMEALGQDASGLTKRLDSPEGKARIYAEWAPEKPPPASSLVR
jgi:putative peptide modification system cyclase